LAYGPSQVTAGKADVVALCLVRDGGIYIPKFIEHHLRLGVKHIIFVDNGSTDGTVEIAAQHQPVSVYTTTAPFRDRNLIRQSMARRFGDGHWTLYLDIDERFDYPHSRALPLAELINYLNRRGFSAVVGHMVDLFPREALLRPDEAAEARDIYSYHAF